MAYVENSCFKPWLGSEASSQNIFNHCVVFRSSTSYVVSIIIFCTLYYTCFYSLVLLIGQRVPYEQGRCILVESVLASSGHI